MVAPIGLPKQSERPNTNGTRSEASQVLHRWYLGAWGPVTSYRFSLKQRGTSTRVREERASTRVCRSCKSEKDTGHL